jgi:hypothetical protein
LQHLSLGYELGRPMPTFEHAHGLSPRNFCTALRYIGEDAGGRVRHLTEVLVLLVETGCIYSLIWVREDITHAIPIHAHICSPDTRSS